MENLKEFQRQITKLGENISQKMFTSSLTSAALEELELVKFNEIPKIEDFDLGLSELRLPIQTFPQGEFSDFSITLYRNDQFCIDVYYWFHSDTSIHDHHFEGAFKVIEGASFQTRYKFETVESRPILSEGKTIELGSEILEKDSVQAIKKGDEFIHKIVHLKFPTITLCVRSPQKSNEYLSIYVPPKYCLNVKSLTPLQHKKVQLLNLACRLDESLKDKTHFESDEIVLLLRLHARRKLFLEDKLVTDFKNELIKRNFATDFESLILEEAKRTAKLKIFTEIV